MNIGVLANIVGSGIGIIVIVVNTVILLPHVGRLPSKVQPWANRAMIIANYGAGSLLAFTGIGVLWTHIASWAARFFGGYSAGIPHMIIVIGAMFLIAGLVIGLLTGSAAAVVVAAFVPAVLMLTSYGFIHGFWDATSGPAQSVAAQFGNWLGG